jgi:hypothetical protein
VLEEGDGAFVSMVNVGDGLVFESIGLEVAEGCGVGCQT